MDFVKSYYTLATSPFVSIRHEDPVRVLYSTRTGLALTVSEDLFRKVDMGEIDSIAVDELEQLIEIEAIVPRSENELHTVTQRNDRHIRDNKTLNYIIQPTAQCQMGCGYCGQAHVKQQMNSELHDNILKRLEFRLQSGDYNSIHVAWFGSEPLMGLRSIRELTPRLIELAAKYECGYGASVVTNGMSLKEQIFEELVEKYSIDSFEVTLDGTAEYHDLRRHTKEGAATFDIIFKNLLAIYNHPRFDELGARVSIRCNVDERNHEGVIKLIRLLAEHKMQNKFSFYTAPIHSWGNDAHMLSLSKEIYANREIDWIMEMAKHDFPLTGLIPGLTRIVCMSVTSDSEVIDAFGNVFNCTEVPYVPVYENSEYVLGNVNKLAPGEINGARSFQTWNEDILTQNNTCSSCKMLPVCGGMCPKSWKEGIPACPSNKFNVLDKLVLAHLLTNKELQA